MDLLTRARASRLDDALSGSSPPPAVASELALAGRLREAGTTLGAVPTTEFRDALRTRLMAVAAVQGVGAGAATRPPAPAAVSWRTRAATVTAGVLATAVAAGGVAVASSRSLPGDPFYDVKRTTEALQLRVAGGDHEEGTRHLQFAAARLREVRAMVLGRGAPPGAVPTSRLEGDDVALVGDALADMDVDTRTGHTLLTDAFQDSRTREPLEQLSRFAEAQGRGLRGVMPALSGPALVQARESLDLVDGVRAEADELLMLADCTTACDPSAAAPTAVPPGTPGDPCGCPTTAPVPQTAPPPAAPRRDAAPSSEQPGSTPSAPAAPPSSEPPPPAGEPSPEPPPPGPSLPVPLPEAPSLPLEPVEPAEPALDDALTGLLGAAPVLLPGAGLLGAAARLLARSLSRG